MHCNETSDFIEIYATEYTEDRIYWMQNSLQSSGKIEDQYILAKKDMNKRQRLNVFYDIAESVSPVLKTCFRKFKMSLMNMVK